MDITVVALIDLDNETLSGAFCHGGVMNYAGALPQEHRLLGGV